MRNVAPDKLHTNFNTKCHILLAVEEVHVTRFYSQEIFRSSQCCFSETLDNQSMSLSAVDCMEMKK